MTLCVFRIGFDGDVTLEGLAYGSRLSNGRWHVNAPGSGQPVVYTAQSRALAQLEKRVHCNGVQPVEQALMRIELLDGALMLHAVDIGLAANWKADEGYTQGFGLAWLRGKKSLGLWVPSYVEPFEGNLLLNPRHDQYHTHVQVVIERSPFEFDPRMLA